MDPEDAPDQPPADEPGEQEPEEQPTTGGAEDLPLEAQTDAVAIDFARGRLVMASRRPYGHVARLFYERPWAVQLTTLEQMSQVLQRRLAGGRLSRGELDAILIDARADHGPDASSVIALGDGEGQFESYYLAGSVAVISMYGILAQRASMFADTSTSGTSIDELRLGLREALADPKVRAVVFDIHSPGGSVDGITEFASELRAARGGDKPIVAQVNTLCASAAYWLASQMNEIVTTPSGEVGSIGVFAMHEDLSKAYEMEGIVPTLISAGKYKVEGNDTEPLSDEARASIQESVDTFYQSFLADVAKGRGLTTGAVADGYGEGRTMLAQKALVAGMVDRIDPIEATVRRLQPRGSGRLAPAAKTSSGSGVVIPLQSAAPAASSGRPDRAWNRRMKGRTR